MAININYRAKAIYVKNQAAIGTAETLTAADILRTSNLEGSIYDGDTTNIDYDGGTGRNAIDRHMTQYNKFSFETDIIGGGVDTGVVQEPPSAAVIRACGFDMDLTDPTQVLFTPSDRSNIDVATVRKVRRVATNAPGDYRVYSYDTLDARGALGISLSDDRPKFTVTDMTGIYQRPVEIASTPLGTDVPNLSISPVTFTNGSFNVLNFNGIELCTHAFNIPNTGWAVAPIDKPNCSDITLTEEKIVMDITFKQLDFATEGNPFEWAEDHDTVQYYPFNLSMDNREGHIFKIGGTARLMNAQETNLEDGNVGIQAQLEIEDDDFNFGFYAAV